MFGWFWINFVSHGMQYGAETLSLPTVKGWDWRFKDGGGYLCLLFVDSEKEREERTKKFREAIRPFVENYDGLWGGYVKEMLNRYNHLKALNHDTATNIQLLENFEEVIDTCRRMWEVHMHMMYGTYTPYVLFEQLCKQMLNIDDTHPTFHRLVSGFDNESFRVDRRLWEFSTKVRDMGLQNLFTETPSKHLKAKLETNDKGKTFLKGFDEFLDKEAGWRMERMAEINVPTWEEDPTPGFETIKFYLKKGGNFDLDEDRKKAEGERKEAEKDVLEKIAPEQKSWFSTLLKVAQNCSRFSEEHNHYLDLYTHALMRRSCMGLGRRFARSGAMNQPEDIFFLMPDEVRRAGINPDKFNLKHLVGRRRKDWEEWCQRGNPPAIMKEGFTLDMAIDLNCEFANFYSAMAYPGSKLYDLALERAIPLPEAWKDYSQHGAGALPLANEHCDAAEILAFRDAAFTEYFTNPRYLDMVGAKFGAEVVDHIGRMVAIPLRRKLLEERRAA